MSTRQRHDVGRLLQSNHDLNERGPTGWAQKRFKEKQQNANPLPEKNGIQARDLGRETTRKTSVSVGETRPHFLLDADKNCER